jgi:hypothetical protein
LIGNGGILKLASSFINGKTKKFLTYDETQCLFDALKDKTKEDRMVFGVLRIRALILPFGLLMIVQVTQDIGGNK